MTEPRDGTVRVRAIAGGGSLAVRTGDGAVLLLSPDGDPASIQPEALFVGGLVACAALCLERSFRGRGFDFEALEARVTTTPDGRRCVTIRVSLPAGFPEGEEDLLRGELLSMCRRYAPACDLEVDLVLEAPRDHRDRRVDPVGVGSRFDT